MIILPPSGNGSTNRFFTNVCPIPPGIPAPRTIDGRPLPLGARLRSNAMYKYIYSVKRVISSGVNKDISIVSY